MQMLPKWRCPKNKFTSCRVVYFHTDFEVIDLVVGSCCMHMHSFCGVWLLKPSIASRIRGAGQQLHQSSPCLSAFCVSLAVL